MWDLIVSVPDHCLSFYFANLVTFHPMVHEITCRQTLFGLILVD